MYQVKGEYTNYQKYNNKGWFHLDSDQALNPYTWKAPIHWSGLVDGIEVKFTQIDSSALSVNSFDWTDFPKQLDSVKSDIADAIDKAMRVMD